MRFGGLTQQSGFWDVASKARNRKSAALPANVRLVVPHLGEAPRVRAAGVVHADRSALRSKRVYKDGDAYFDAVCALFTGKSPKKR